MARCTHAAASLQFSGGRVILRKIGRLLRNLIPTALLASPVILDIRRVSVRPPLRAF